MPANQPNDGPYPLSDALSAFFGSLHPCRYCSDVNNEIPGGCDAVQGSFSAGLVGVLRARFILNLTFKPGTGALVPLGQADPPFLNSNTRPPEAASSDASSTNGSGVHNVTSLQAIISIEPRRYLTQLDAREDYSFMATPLRSDEEQAESKILLRVPEPNPYIPAFVGGELAWGTPPRAGPFRQRNSSATQCIALKKGSKLAAIFYLTIATAASARERLFLF
ncbi:hypothetical protein DUNSADRAFT_3977 [Dunaliella salina]|uniref:Encoded protein n=1 Tax=Dunaliella salina TaxID=3046 RepID=A0ABQ7GSY5_DUNSA|nr:hypothetical protein DUNSADRAFT_3977 [Dunaliella salina]|eukprot:KAF5837722.1 hypothetical protein DUNSADRAFT_3977 [Dunaliella salina]